MKEAPGETRQKSAEVGNCVCDDYIHGTKWMEMIMNRKDQARGSLANRNRVQY